MPLENYLAFFLATMAVLISPGPTVFYILNVILRRGRAHGSAAVAGVVLGDTVAVVASLTGLGALLALSSWGFEAFRLFAACYLIYLGVKALLARDSSLASALPVENGGNGMSPKSTAENPGSMNTAGSQTAASQVDRWQTFRAAFIITALNPKGILFFTAFFPLFLSREANPVTQLTLMSATFVVLGGINAGFYVMATDMLRVRLRSRRTVTWLQRFSGAALVAAGSALLARGGRAA